MGSPQIFMGSVPRLASSPIYPPRHDHFTGLNSYGNSSSSPMSYVNRYLFEEFKNGPIKNHSLLIVKSVEYELEKLQGQGWRLQRKLMLGKYSKSRELKVRLNQSIFLVFGDWSSEYRGLRFNKSMKIFRDSTTYEF